MRRQDYDLIDMADGKVVASVRHLWPEEPVTCCMCERPTFSTVAVPYYCGPVREGCSQGGYSTACESCYARWERWNDAGMARFRKPAHGGYPDSGVPDAYGGPAEPIRPAGVLAPAPAIPATWQHDAGAYARCSFCLRYTRNPMALSHSTFRCDCGSADGWSGSFKPPGADARWIAADGVKSTFPCRRPAIGPACETQCEKCAADGVSEAGHHTKPRADADGAAG